MTEFISALGVLWCAILYWLGGQEIPGLGRGFKALRRYVLPVGLAGFLLALGGPWLRVLPACGLLCGALHLGYQAKPWKFALTGLLYGAPALILTWPKIGWLWALPAIFHLFFGLISLSSNGFKWAFVALLVGTSIGVAFLSSVLI